MRSITALIGSLCLLIAAQLQAEIVGWRTDATGKYPDAKPVIEWSPDKNVVWKTKMPSWSNSIPIIVGDRLFVCSEPTTLLCVRLSDGEILWQKDNDVMDTLTEAEGESVKQKMKDADVTGKQKRFRQLEGDLRKVQRALRKKRNDEELKTKRGELQKSVRDLRRELAPFAKFSKPKTHSINGYSTCTPVSDGKNVWVLFGTGVTACYDLDGNRKWITFVEQPTKGYGHSASPLLADGKLIVHIRGVTALDAATGKILWQNKTSRSAWGTGIIEKIGRTEVVITPAGDVLRLSDGKRLAKSISKLDFCQPLLEDGKLYFVQRGGRCLTLPADAGEGMRPETVYTFKVKKDRYYASPVLDDGRIYAITRANNFSVINAADGTLLHEEALKGLGGTAYPSITLAGEYLFVSSDKGKTIVMKPGAKPEVVAQNSLEPFRSSPVFKGSRMYIRGLKHLWCIGK